jgi:uncharacterized membrane-anchored protein YitT (DUF2179 family)
LTTFIRSFIAITLGAALFSFGLEGFLVPHQVIDGGIVGISLITANLTSIPFSILLIVLNLPFLFIGYKQIGMKFVIFSFYGIVMASVFSILIGKMLHHQPVTSDPLLGTIFGGIILGIGVGMVIRNGGSLDGTEITAILINKKVPFSVGEIVMFFNLFILGSAGFVFGWDQAMYSLLAYFIAYKTIDVTVEGLDQTRAVTIISDHAEEIGDAISEKLGRGVTYLQGKGGYTGIDKAIIYCIITRLEESAFKSIVEEIDKDAFIAVSHIHDVKGGQFKKKDIH